MEPVHSTGLQHSEKLWLADCSELCSAISSNPHRGAALLQMHEEIRKIQELNKARSDLAFGSTLADIDVKYRDFEKKLKESRARLEVRCPLCDTTSWPASCLVEGACQWHCHPLCGG